MKRFICIIIAAIMLVSLSALTVSGESNGNKGLLVDNTGRQYIDGAARAEIEAFIDKAYSEYNTSVIIVYMDEVPQDDDERDREAEDYYYNGNFCDSGVILYLGAITRSFDIFVHHGDKFGTITSSEGDGLNEAIMPLLKNNDFKGAAVRFAALSYEYSANNENEKLLNGRTTDEIFTDILISFAIALVISLIIVFIMKSRNKTVKAAGSAGEYVIGGSNLMTLTTDKFLYSSITKVKIPEKSSSGGGRSGGGSGGGSHHGGHF